VRLVGSGLPREGRLEVYSNGQWGTITMRRTYEIVRRYWYHIYRDYRDYFDSVDASIACHMLGFE